MLEHHGDAGDRLFDALISDPDLAGIVRQQPINATEQRGLAAAGRADDGDDLALGHLEVDVAEDFERAVALGQSFDADARFGSASCRAERGYSGLLLCHSAASDDGLGLILAQ